MDKWPKEIFFLNVFIQFFDTITFPVLGFYNVMIIVDIGVLQVRTGTPYCTLFTAYCTLHGSVCCSVRVMNMHTFRYRYCADMYLHDELLEA